MRLGLLVALLTACAPSVESEPAADGTSNAGFLESTRIQLDQEACYADFEDCYASANGLAEQDVCEFALEDCIAQTGGRPQPVETPCDEQLQACLEEGYDPDECQEEAEFCRELQGA